MRGHPDLKPSRRSAERRAHRSQGARRALTSAAREQGIRACRRSAIPSRGGSKRKDTRGAASAAGARESRGSTRIAVRKNERVVAGTSGTGLFDIVNRGSAATRRLGFVSRGDAPSCVVVARATHETVVPAQAGTQYSRDLSVWHDGSPLSRGRQHGRMGNARPRPVLFSCCLQEKQEATPRAPLTSATCAPAWRPHRRPAATCRNGCRSGASARRP